MLSLFCILASLFFTKVRSCFFVLDDFVSDSFELGVESHDVLVSELVDCLVVVVCLIHFVGSAASSNET